MNRTLLYSALALVVIGLIMVYSSSSVMAESRFGSQFHFLKRQLLWLLVSLLAAAVIMKIDLKKYAVYSVPAILFTLVLLVGVFFMPARNGSHRWLFIGPFSFQPSELYKLVVLFFLAFSLSQKKRDIANLRQLMMPYVPILGIGLLLIIMEPGLGSALTIALTVITVFFLAGVRIRHLAAFTLPLASVVAFMVLVLGYKKARLIDYLAAIDDPLTGSYQVKQAVLTLGAGGIFGSGLGDGRQKLFFLPYPHTDFIFATIGEEFGFVGLMAIMVLFYMIVWQGRKISLYQPDRFGYLLGMGMTASIFIAVIINIGVVTSVLPTTGIPLPFLSYGGTSLLISITSIAVLLNLSRRKGVKVR